MNERIQRELQKSVEAFATDVTAILQRAVADAVAEALGGSRRATTAAKGTSALRGGKTEAARAARAEALLRELKRKGDRRIEEIAKSMRTSTKALTAPMGRLLSAKQVKKTGVARGTKYRVA
ncbi:MAG: hypothetical protein HYS27_23015 [Deltaproteobacteria bacterium]|nr:hypothetical protein [Deltaproteobacteria bacterium]